MSAAPTQTPEPAVAKSGFAALAVLFAVVFINMVGFGIMISLQPFFGLSLHAPPHLVVYMFAAYSCGQFFAEPFWGRLSDRIGRKPVLMMTTLANVVGYIALAFAPNIWVAIAVRLFTGMGAGNVSTIQGYIADVTPPERRAGRMGMVGAAFGLGFVVGPGFGGLLVRKDLGHLGYQVPLFAAAAVCALACLGVIIFLCESRRAADPRAPRPAFLAGIGDARRNPVISRVVLVTFVYMGAFSGMETAFGFWARQRFGWDALELGLSFTVVGVVSALSQALLTGRLARLFGEARVLTFGMLLFGASLLAQVLVRQSALVPVIMAFGAFGMALAMPNISALISRSAPPDRQGALLGLNMACGSAARMVAPIIAGLLFDNLGADIPFLVGAALTIPAAILAVNAGRAFAAAQKAAAA